ncbi:MAG: isoleucine--tRNA ligase [Bacteroidales bacterium]|jgi:isoleucyl-tRNA synthetase|nr:isoleucine--tRNA ligase [Bacteroidales bacterium]MDY0314696.1 isoleucine--tRNA ligase [Bacteroidales bacterium]
MNKKFTEYKQLDLAAINLEIQELWKKEKTFEKSLETRKDNKAFIFFEGPPSANGTPGIHHVMARAIKDVVCRYKTLTSYRVDRKAGWDTHGLPVELSVEKTLGITKENIGKTISVKEYNNTCRKEVMKYTDLWEKLTEQMGYWVDMENPYITYDNRYIETVWYLLKKLFDKNLLYKGYTIQPYSPAAGTGLSTHELNQPGCYKDVKDTTIVALFSVIRNEFSEKFFSKENENLHILAWTTTPWTLPSNTALAVGPEIKYVKINTFNPYSGNPISLIVCKDRVSAYFKSEAQNLDFQSFKLGDKNIPWKIEQEYSGKDLVGIVYEQLIDWVKPKTPAFKLIAGDYVTTEDGTGIVHIAPTFGADDARVAKAAGIPALILEDKDGNICPMVDKQGKFFKIEDLQPKFVENFVNTESYKNFAGKFVKNEYDDNANPDSSTDVEIAVMLKIQDKAFKIEKYTHNYPHCWRTDKPILYYPMDSWFIKTTEVKDRMIELNKTINWKPASTGEGRFGKWLENLVDWNLSRSRYWGTPLPIWSTEDGSERKCIGSVKELIEEIEISVKNGFMSANLWKGFVPGDYSKENYEKIDLHRPDVDEIVLVSSNGKKMFREPDLIDVWFDSGAMPYAQWHWPFENKENFENLFPADFIAEGVDQTRGWFFTLHAISTMISDQVAFKNIISNGLVLDKEGNKMSKRLGNAVDPFLAMDEYGADAVRWYMITNSQAWDNLKFDISGVDEVKRKFFGTIYNTYNFFALYANIDNFKNLDKEIEFDKRPELDKWILSLLNSLIKEIANAYENYENTKAGRLIQDFVIDHLSNWYVRLGRKRYWGGEYNEDKISAYQTLYTCLLTISKLASPIAPFYMDKLYRDLVSVNDNEKYTSVHLAYFPEVNENFIDKELEERMEMAQSISSMILSLRRKANFKVRQPLQKIMMPIISNNFVEQIEKVEQIIKTETNIKEIEFLSDDSDVLVKKIKANFKVLGPKYGKIMKQVAAKISEMSQKDIAEFERLNSFSFAIENQEVNLSLEDVEIISEDIPGWLVANEGKITLALDINLSSELIEEGIAREFVNRIQNLRKESGFDVVDKINIFIQSHPELNTAITKFDKYICSQTLADTINIVDKMEQNNNISVKINNFDTLLCVNKV